VRRITVGTQTDLFVPDRFDALQGRVSPGELRGFIMRVDDAIRRIDTLRQDMMAAGRGAFLIFRGDSGSGKSTLLNTLGLFMDGVEIMQVVRGQSVEQALRTAPATKARLRVVTIEGRDALRDVQRVELEGAVHEINGFIRDSRGARTIVVWPVNADDLQEVLVEIAGRVGADSLLGVGEPTYRFSGPPREQYREIASRTVAVLNQGASLADLGVGHERAEELVAQAGTIGQFLGLLRGDLLANQRRVESLLVREPFRLWIVVVASNDPEGDVAGLTRGAVSSVDIERLMGATGANIVKTLKEFPDKLGILGTVLDGKLAYLPSVTALAVARDHADERLRGEMADRDMSISKTGDGVRRLSDSELARAFTRTPMGPRTRGPKPGSNTEEAFRKLASIAETNDGLLNAAIGRALVAAGLVSSFATERDLGTGLTRRTDLVCQSDTLGAVRVEVMWRQETGRAEIANYTLTKLFNYGRAIGFLESGRAGSGG
jgi:energy-coupling factor transporter ATP-binding protein EcfA2